MDDKDDGAQPATESAQHASVDAASQRRGRSPSDKSEPSTLPSFIWDYFIKDTTGKFVICMLCPAQTTRFAYSGGTSTMNRHLRKKHHKYAPGKTAADYDQPRTQRRAGHTHNASHSPAAAPSGLLPPDTAGMLGSLSPAEQGRQRQHQLLELRTARRRATSGQVAKRRRLPEQETATSMTGAEFDPSGLVTLSTGGAVQFPTGFELNEAAMEVGVGLDQRYFDSSSVAGSTSGSLRGRRLSSGSNTAANASVTGLNVASQKVLTHRLLKYLIAQYEPLDVSHMGCELSLLLFGSSTEWPSQGLNYGYGVVFGGAVPKLPSEETIKMALANLYYSQREILKEVMADVDFLSLSLNNWTSAFGQNVLTVSGHWITRGFRRRDCVLEVYVLPLDERVNTIALLRDVMDKWDIPTSKVTALTMYPLGSSAATGQDDENENPQTTTKAEASAIHSEYPDLQVVRCFVEELEGAMSSGLRECSELTRRCRNYVSYFIQNPSEYQIFLALQHEEESPTPTTPLTVDNGASLPVICDFDDRWNSTAEMMCRIVELEPMLLRYKAGLESDANPARRPMQLRFVCCELSPAEWVVLKQLARLLEPIEGVVHVSPLAYPGLSMVYPLMHSLKKHLDDSVTWVTEPLVVVVRHSIIDNLNTQLCWSSTTAASPYLSCLLDPRFKTLPFLPSEERERLVGLLYLLLGVNDKEEVGGTEPNPTAEGDRSDERLKRQDRKASTGSVAAPNKKTATLLHEFFPLDEPTTENDKLKAQVQQYLDSPSLPATDETEHDPLEWWSRYQRMFPALARLAKKYLCISAVSTPFQEAFTNYGQLMREKRARLDIEVAAQVLFCRSVSRIPEMERIGV